MLKVGDGATPWNELAYYETGGGGINSDMPHDGTVFPVDEVTTGKEAIFYTQKQINVWKACAVQDYKDAWDDKAPTCVSDGTIS
jgi:hypothetical protein